MSLRDVVADIDRWRSEDKEIALATVVHTWGSGPRGPGAKMALTLDAQIAGSVSGGCVEASVVEEGGEVIEEGTPKLLRFGVADETAWEVGLSCGGTIEVFVERLDDAFYVPLKRTYEASRPIARATILTGDEAGRTVVVSEDGVVSKGEAEGETVEAARAALERGRSERVSISERDVFIDVELPPTRLVMVGGVHIAIALSSLAKTLGYRTIIVDPRSVFGSEERFPHVDELRHDWPDEALSDLRLNRSTAVATLTHDPKLDDPALEVALRSPAFYVGALGSRKTHGKRRGRLLDRGLTEEELSRLHAPIGLAIGSRSPQEIALSILGEIVAAQNGVEV